MTGVTMSLFGSHPHLPGGHVQTAQSNIFKSEIKKQLGFSIDSIVGKSSEVSPRSPPASPVASLSPPPVIPRHSISPKRERSRSPIRRSVSPPPPSSHRRSPLSAPASPPVSSPGLYRPSPASASYLHDQLAQLKAFYEAKGQSVPGLGAPAPGHLLPPGLAGGLPVTGLPGFPRVPPASSLPHPFLSLPGAGHLAGGPLGGPQPPHGVPREFPLHPWFINRHRFPLGGYIINLINSRIFL